MLLPVVLVLAQNDHKGSDLNKAFNDHKGATTTTDVAFADHHAAMSAALFGDISIRCTSTSCPADAASRNMRVSSSVGPVDAPSAMAIA